MRRIQTLQIDHNSLEYKLKIAHAWKLKGRLETAVNLYQQILEIDPNNLIAHQSLGNLFIKQGKIQEALFHYDRALAIDSEQVNLSLYYGSQGLSFLEKEQKAGINTTYVPDLKNNHLPNNPQGKINLANQAQFIFHRSGWNFALDAIAPLHNNQGILFDGFIEKTFVWQCQTDDVRSNLMLAKIKQDGVFELLATNIEKGIIPYQKSWVGFMHNPPNVPEWLHPESTQQLLLSRDVWQKSLENCIGLFTLSEYHAQWLREQTQKPVSSLIAPTEIPEQQFSWEKFINNPQKKIIQIGWWLRKLYGIYQLPIPKNNPLNFQKIMLIPKFSINSNHVLDNNMKKQIEVEGIEIQEKYWENTEKLEHLTNEKYDEFLAKNIAFIYLYDASANNGVIECIARATPLLVNPLPAVMEYLGVDYPLYFHNLKEASEKANDLDLIKQAHDYLKNCPTRKKLSPEYFCYSFKTSEVYQLI